MSTNDDDNKKTPSADDFDVTVYLDNIVAKLPIHPANKDRFKQFFEFQTTQRAFDRRMTLFLHMTKEDLTSEMTTIGPVSKRDLNEMYRLIRWFHHYDMPDDFDWSPTSFTDDFYDGGIIVTPGEHESVATASKKSDGNGSKRNKNCRGDNS